MSIRTIRLFDDKRRIIKYIQDKYPVTIDVSDHEKYKLYRTRFRRDSYFFQMHMQDSILSSYADILSGISTLVNVAAFTATVYCVYFVIRKLVEIAQMIVTLN